MILLRHLNPWLQRVGLSFLTRDGTLAPALGVRHLIPLDHQGSPLNSVFSLIFFPLKETCGGTHLRSPAYQIFTFPPSPAHYRGGIGLQRLAHVIDHAPQICQGLVSIYLLKKDPQELPLSALVQAAAARRAWMKE